MKHNSPEVGIDVHSSSDFRDNTHRTLQELVSVNAWFARDPKNHTRFTLHADVAFNEARLGGDADTKVTFKLSVKRCDIIFVPPAAAPFRVDPSSVRSPRPLNPKSVTQTDKTSRSFGARATLSLKNAVPDASIDASASHQRQQEKITTSEQTIGMYHERWKMVRENHAWSVDGKDLSEGRLIGGVFDPHTEPRLSLFDERTDPEKARAQTHNTHPMATIRVRCLREDIDIYDIDFKDPEKQRWLKKHTNKQANLLVAREVLREALLREGLSAGNIVHDPYAEMTVCDVTISIIDSGS